MSVRLSLPINAKSPLSTLKRWAATIGNHVLITLADFLVHNYQPSYSCSGTMTFTSVITQMAWYINVGPLVLFSVDAWGTIGGVADTEVRLSLPIKAASAYGCFAGAVSIDGGLSKGATVLLLSPDIVKIRRYDNANWTAGASRAARVMGFYLKSNV